MIYGDATFGGRDLGFQSVIPMCPKGGAPPQLPANPDTSWSRFTQVGAVLPGPRGFIRRTRFSHVRSGNARVLPPLRNPRRNLLGLGSTRAEASSITAIMNALTTLHSGVNEASADVWNAVAADIAKAGKMPEGVPYFPGLDWVNDEIIKRVNDVMPSPSYWPTTDAVNFAQQRLREFQAMLNYVKSAAPAVAQKVEDRQAVVAKQVAAITPIRDPNVVGWETFKTELQKRAENLGDKLSLGFGWGTAAAIGAGVLAILFFAMRMRGGK